MPWRFWSTKPIRIEDVFQEADALDVHSFRGRERMQVHEARTLADRDSAVVRGSVRVWPRRRQRIA